MNPPPDVIDVAAKAEADTKPIQTTPIFRKGDTVEINGGRFVIHSIGKNMMLLYPVAGKKPTLETDLPIQSRIENCERELAALIKIRNGGL